MKSIPLKCPCHPDQELIKVNNNYVCSLNECEHNKEENAFPSLNNVPILISENGTDTVCTMSGSVTYVNRPSTRLDFLKKILVGESKVTKINCEQFIKEVYKINANPKILVIGGGEKGSATENLYNAENIEIHSVDIYLSDFIDVVCDAHYLPLENDFYDGVWIQAVLEHVVEPSVVVDEIHRVLKIDGIVYAETPFMQQVHEGAYDFTRFTVLGHRYLFKKFDLINMGGNQGPEVVFALSVRYLAWALLRSRIIAKFIGIFIGILVRPFSFIVSKESMYDASSGVFFIGKKHTNKNLSHKDLVSLYKGQY